ncbi:site-specific integrase [Dyadobacter sp. 32]|uniref:site-specific integrase n=1 Tax=Dyadobacter sp. 32 TaxID=538966 RepID=UPI0011ECA5D8
METRFSILFYGKKAKMTKEGLVPIYLRVTIGGERFEISTHRYVQPEKWSVAASRVKGNSAEARTINTYLDSLLGKAYVYQQELINENKDVNIKNFTAKWSGEKQKPVMLLDVFDRHNAQLKELLGNGYAPATLTKYRTTREYAQQYIAWKYKLKDIGLVALDYEFISEFEFWLKTQKKCAHNTTMKYLINFKKVVLIGVKNGWISKDPFAGYKMTRESVNRSALTEKELAKIAGKDFENFRLNQVRDIFVFCCYTGLAYVDVSKLTSRNIIDGYGGEKWLTIDRQKNDSQARIPLLAPALKILKAYKDHPQCQNTDSVLPVLSNQKMNSYLKEIGDLCRINTQITFHLARHTFATTVTLTNGVPIESVSKMLGHSSIKTTQIYAKIVDKKISEDMQILQSKLLA